MTAASERLTGRQRIELAFAHERADRIAVFDVANNPALFKLMLGKENPWSDGLPTAMLAKRLGLDAAMVPVRPYTALIPIRSSWDAPDGFTDRFGVHYQVNDSSWPLGMAVGERPLDEAFLETVENARVDDADIEPVRSALMEAHRTTQSGSPIALFAGVRSAFSFLFISGGLAGLSMAMYDEPALVHRLVQAASSYWTELGVRLIEAGADALYVANDMGMNGSTIISPDQLREFFLPEFARQCRTWKQAGGRVILHSCGNIMAILDDLAAMGNEGIDALNNLQVHAGMDIRTVKETYGHRWTLIGNVDATTTMCSDDPADIDRALDELVSIVGYDGGAILATDHSFHKGIPVSNVFHFIEQAKKIGTSPVSGGSR